MNNICHSAWLHGPHQNPWFTRSNKKLKCPNCSYHLKGFRGFWGTFPSKRGMLCISTSEQVLRTPFAGWTYKRNKIKKKERKATQKHAIKEGIFPRSRPAFGCQPAFRSNTIIIYNVVNPGLTSACVLLFFCIFLNILWQKLTEKVV